MGINRVWGLHHGFRYKKGIFVTGNNGFLSVNLGFLTLSETGINAESMAGTERGFRHYFYDTSATFTVYMNDSIDST
jgi:hypothetical protein